MFSITKLVRILGRIWAPALVFGVVAASGYALQAVQQPGTQLGITQATR